MAPVRFLLAVTASSFFLFSIPVPADSSAGAAPPPARRVVDTGVARAVATEILPIFYEGSWTCFTHIPYSDLDGQPRAHAFVFSKIATDARESAGDDTHQTLSTLEKALEQETEEIERFSALVEETRAKGMNLDEVTRANIAQQAQQLADLREALRRDDQFVTIVTGAQDDMPLVLKCYRGLPPAWAGRSQALKRLRKHDPGSAWQIVGFLYVNPFLEAVEAAPLPDLPTSASQDRNVMVDLSTGKIEALAAIRERLRNTNLIALSRQPEDRDLTGQDNRRAWEKWRLGVSDPARAGTGKAPVRTLRGNVPREK